MAIVSMTKMKLMAMSYHKEKILNALHKTGCVELFEPEAAEHTFCVQDKTLAELESRLAEYTHAVDFVSDVLEKNKDLARGGEGGKYLSNFFLSYDEFMSTPDREPDLVLKAEKVAEYESKLTDLRAESIKLHNLKVQLLPYSGVKRKFSEFKDTKTCSVFFGTVKKEQLPQIYSLKKENEPIEVSVLADAQGVAVLVVCLKSEKDRVQKRLSEAAFVSCPFSYDMSAREKIEEIVGQAKEVKKEEERINAAICGQPELLKDLKILADYYSFAVEKTRDAEKFRHTGTTFILEGYVPEGEEERVKSAVSMVTDAVFTEFSKPEENDTPPTLTKNGKVITQAEFITNLYSAPNYREVDPNGAVFFFFMIFMGVIMADIGYGIIMIIAGLTLAFRIKVDNGARRLWFIIACGGVFSIIFGVLFNSFFGAALLPFSILPSPVPDGNGTTGLMTILLGCLALGVLHIATGYFFKALNCFKQKDVAGGIFEGLIWVLFFIGFVLAAFNFLVGYLMPEALENMNAGVRNFFDAAALPGLIIVGVTLLIAALTAGRKEKGFGKVSKGFGAIYGIISLMSDILSYARLFGLMLSGMIIASTFNDLGLSIMSGGSLGYIFGPLVIGVGHIFNIAMGVLGAYIHDSRLQYIEFFSKFYTGEGEKFTPLGSDIRYIYLTK